MRLERKECQRRGCGNPRACKGRDKKTGRSLSRSWCEWHWDFLKRNRNGIQSVSRHVYGGSPGSMGGAGGAASIFAGSFIVEKYEAMQKAIDDHKAYEAAQVQKSPRNAGNFGGMTADTIIIDEAGEI